MMSVYLGSLSRKSASEGLAYIGTEVKAVKTSRKVQMDVCML